MTGRINVTELHERSRAGLSDIYDWDRFHRPPPDVVLALVEAVEAARACFDESLAQADVGDEAVSREARVVDALARFDFSEAE